MWVGEKKTSVKVQVVVNAEKAGEEDQLADANSLAINFVKAYQGLCIEHKHSDSAM